MRERDLQDYIFQNPAVLFPGQIVQSKRREVFIEGRRIDLLFDVEGVSYIVELKADTITREAVGQVFEYYALMRMARTTAAFRMVLVAPVIPDFRRLPLEEFGIRCVEVRHPEFGISQQTVVQTTLIETKQQGSKPVDGLGTPSVSPVESVHYEDFFPPANTRSLNLSHALLRDGLLHVERIYSEYEILPIKMKSPTSQDVFCFPNPGSNVEQFLRGGAWWAYALGHSEKMPKNDVPNISVCAQPWGLDITVNAELRTSQSVIRHKVASAVGQFDELVESHPKLELQLWLKLEHQPRFYYWVLLKRALHGSWNGEELLQAYSDAEAEYASLREKWIEWLEGHQKDLSAAQARHMRRMNRSLNLAIRLARSYGMNEPFWGLDYPEQQRQFAGEYARMKPFVDFFQT